MRIRTPLAVALFAVVVLVGLTASLVTSHNPRAVPGSLSDLVHAQSTGLYCTGLVEGEGTDRVVFVNTTDEARAVSLVRVSDGGLTSAASFDLGPGAAHAYAIRVAGQSSDHVDGVAAIVHGGGVVADEVLGGPAGASAPCQSRGVTSWFGAGFDTLEGSRAVLSFYNPTATPAVLNVALYTSSGVSEPTSLEGLAVPAHAEEDLNLGSYVSNTANVGARVTVLHGSLAVTGLQDSGGTWSLDAGQTRASTTGYFPLVTTAKGALAQVRLVNPSADPVDVTLDVTLGHYAIAPRTTTLAPYATGLVTLNPNTAIPAAGYAAVTLHASRPVAASLAAGTSSGIALSPPSPSGGTYVVGRYAGQPYDGATLTNVGRATVTGEVDVIAGTGPTTSPASTSFNLSGGQSIDLDTLLPDLTGTTGRYAVITAPGRLVVGLALATTPRGRTVVTALDGR